MSQEEVADTNVDNNGSSSTGGDSSVLGDTGNANTASSSQAKQVPKKGSKKQTSAARSAAAKKAAAARKAKDDRLAQLEERVAFFDNLYQQAEAEVGQAGAQEPEEETEPSRPGDPGYHPGVGDVETTEDILDAGANHGDMDDSGGAASAPAVPQRRRFTGRRSGGAFNRRLYDKLDAAQGVVMSARGKVGSRKRIGSLFTKVHRGMSEEELARFAIGSIRQNQYA